MSTIGSSGNFRDGLKHLLRNLFAGVKLAVLRPVEAENLTATFTQLMGLVALLLVLAFAGDFLPVGLDGHFLAWGLSGALFFLPVILCAAWLLALLAGDSGRTLPLAVALLALTAPIELIALVARTVADAWLRGYVAWQFHAYLKVAIGIWFGLAGVVAAVRLGPIPLAGGRRVPATLVAAGVLVWPSIVFEPLAPLWAKNEREDTAERMARVQAIASEEAFYLQPKLLERALGRIEPGRKGVVDVYFVGVGGYASQDVFLREVRSAERLFEERFDAAGRTVTLINNPKTAAEVPLASVTALERALDRVGAVMDRNEDVLFLFLTSHGSRDHRFSLESWPLRLNQLDPARLKSLLDASGIKWKVVVVSACYSGGFADSLKDETTLVITAAAHDRNSFGCSNEADFTYFGKAYFDEALRQTHSFVEAFERAAAAIEKRETAEQKTPSLPQIRAGAAIVEHLKQLEARPKSDPAAAEGVAAATAPEDRRYVDLARSLFPSEVFKAHRSSCLELMGTSAPHRNVEREPNYYGGIRPGSPLWPRLVAAYEDFVEATCASQEPFLLDAYARDLRHRLPPEQLERTVRFLATDSGQAFRTAYVEATLEATRVSTVRLKEVNEAATRRFNEAMKRIGAENERQAARSSK